MPNTPQVTIEVISPDDILVLSLNNKWFRTFTSSSDRYPIRIKVPSTFVNDGWNLVVGDYSNVALVGKNDANVEYKVYLDDNEVVHVTYKTEVHPQHFNVSFKDTFSSGARSIDRGEAGDRSSKRFDEMMDWGKKGSRTMQPRRMD